MQTFDAQQPPATIATDAENQALIARWRQVKTDVARLNPTVKLLAVSKTKPNWMIRTLAQQGQQDFGENYVQEAVAKIAALKNVTANERRSKVMESSRQPAGVFKGRVVDHRAQRHWLRCASIESLLEDEDQAESGLRYIDSKQATRSITRERPHSRSVGTDTRVPQD